MPDIHDRSAVNRRSTRRDERIGRPIITVSIYANWQWTLAALIIAGALNLTMVWLLWTG